MRQLKQVPVALVLQRLEAAKSVRTATMPDLGGEVVILNQPDLGHADYQGFKGRRLA